MRKSTALLGLALGLAIGLFAFTFRGPRKRFWDRMTATGLALGSLSLAARPGLRRTRISGGDVLLGVGSAGLLYGVFQLGDRMARRIFSLGASQIEAIYQLKFLRPRGELMARLGLIIAPAEELFWRGYFQHSLMKRFGRIWGTLTGAAAYAGVHLASGNLILIGAAGVAGSFWSVMYALGAPLGALVVSHVVWDILIFLIAPTSRLAIDS